MIGTQKLWPQARKCGELSTRQGRAGRMLLQWATFRACSGFRYIQMGNPRKEDVFDDVDGMCEAVRKVVGSAPFHPLRLRFKIHGGTIVARRWGRAFALNTYSSRHVGAGSPSRNRLHSAEAMPCLAKRGQEALAGTAREQPAVDGQLGAKGSCALIRRATTRESRPTVPSSREPV